MDTKNLMLLLVISFFQICYQVPRLWYKSAIMIKSLSICAALWATGPGLFGHTLNVAWKYGRPFKVFIFPEIIFTSLCLHVQLFCPCMWLCCKMWEPKKPMKETNKNQGSPCFITIADFFNIFLANVKKIWFKMIIMMLTFCWGWAMLIYLFCELYCCWTYRDVICSFITCQ